MTRRFPGLGPRVANLPYISLMSVSRSKRHSGEASVRAYRRPASRDVLEVSNISFDVHVITTTGYADLACRPSWRCRLPVCVEVESDVRFLVFKGACSKSLLSSRGGFHWEGEFPP